MALSEIHPRIQEISAPGNQVTQLNLRYDNIGDAGAQALAAALQSQHCSLTWLDLDNNNIGEAGAQALASALQSKHCSLTYLNLWGNKIGDAGAQALATALQSQHCSLTQLVLYGNSIGEAGAQALASALQSQQCSLTTLNLESNEVGEAGAQALASALQSQHCSLTYLNLWGNNIGEAGAQALATALQSQHCSLTELNLQDNYIGDAGAQALATALQSQHCSLTELYLGNNNIGDAGAQALAQALQSQHCSLTKLDLSRNNIGQAGARALAEAMEQNRQITNMELWDNKITKALQYKIKSYFKISIQDKINTYLQRNRNRQDDFLRKIQRAVGHNDQPKLVVAAINDIMTTISYQRYALIDMIESAGKEDLPSEQRAQYLAMIECLLAHGVPVNGDVLREALETGQEDIIRRVKPAPTPVGAAAEAPMPPAPVRRGLQAEDVPAMKTMAPSSSPFKKTSVQAAEQPVHTQAASPAAEEAEATPVITASEQAVAKITQAAAAEPSPVETPISPAPIVPKLNHQVTQFTDADATFITHLRTHSANLATTDQLASLYLKGEQGAEDINTVLQLRQLIAADGSKQQLYEDLQLQLNAIIRAIQQANITYSDRSTVSGKNWMEYFSQYAKEAAGISKATSIVFGVGEYLYDTYRENKFQARCKRVANLQGDGDQDIRLLSEALSRRIVLDDTLLGTPKLQEDTLAKKSPWLDTSALKPSKMGDRLAKNRFMEQAPRVLKISSLVLTCIFDSDAFDRRQVVDVTLVDNLHQQLRVKVGLSAQAEAPTLQTRVVTPPVSEPSSSLPAPAVAPTSSASLTATMQAPTSASAFDGAAMMAMMQKMQEDALKQQEDFRKQQEDFRRQQEDFQKQQERMNKLEQENQSLKSKLPQDDVTVTSGGGGGLALAQIQAQSQSSASKTGQGMTSNPLTLARDMEDFREALGDLSSRVAHTEAVLEIPGQAAEKPNPEREAQADADRKALFSP